MADQRAIAPQTTDEDQIDIPRRNLVVPEDVAPTVARQVAPEGYYQLAEALGKVSNDVNQYANRNYDQEKVQDVQLGRAAAIKSAVDYGTAVKSGAIGANESPWFVKGYKELYGQNQADAAFGQIQQDYDNSPIKSTTDPQALQQWTQQRMSGALQGITDPDVLVGATEKLQQHAQNLYGQQAAQLRQNTLYGMTTAAGTQIGNLIDQYQASNQGQPTNASALAGILQGPNGLMKFSGLDPKDADNTFANTVISKAMQYKDPTILDVLSQSRPDVNNPSQVVPGPGNGGEIGARVFAARREIANQLFEDQNRAHELEQQTRKATIDNLWGSIADGVIHGQSPPSGAMDQLIKLDGSKAEQLIGLHKAILSQSEEMSPSAFASVLPTLLGPQADGQSRADAVIKAATSGRLTMAPEQLTSLYEHAQSLDNSGIDRMAPVTQILSSLQKDGDPTTGLPSMFKDPNAKSEVVYNFMMGANALIKANPNTDPEALRPQLMQLRDQVINNYATLHPAMISMGPVKKANAEESLTSATPKSTAASTAPTEPYITPSGAPPSPFSAPPPEAIRDLTSHLDDTAKVKAFKGKYGDSAYFKILKATQ